jgi:hypothetical protein
VICNVAVTFMANDEGQTADRIDGNRIGSSPRSMPASAAMCDLRWRSRIAVLAMKEFAISRAAFCRLLARNEVVVEALKSVASHVPTATSAHLCPTVSPLTVHLR